MKYTTDHFIKKVENTPEEMFCTGAYQDGAKVCILAMCGQRPGKRTLEADSLISLFLKIGTSPIPVNDGSFKRYKQATPKQRLLAALEDIKIVEQQEANVEAIAKVQCIQSLGVD